MLQSWFQILFFHGTTKCCASLQLGHGPRLPGRWKNVSMVRYDLCMAGLWMGIYSHPWFNGCYILESFLIMLMHIACFSKALTPQNHSETKTPPFKNKRITFDRGTSQPTKNTVSFVELPVGMFNIDPVYGTSTSLMDHARTMELNMDFQNCCYISWRQCGTCWLNERSHEPLHVTNQYIYRYTYNNIEKICFYELDSILRLSQDDVN